MTVLWICVGFLTWIVAGPSSWAADVPSEIEGNWSVESQDYPEKGKVTRALVVLSRRWERVVTKLEDGGSRYLMQPHPTDRVWTVRYTVDMKNWGGGQPQVDEQGNVTVKWGRQSAIRRAGPNELRGRWTERDKSGAEIWTRAVPRVTRVVFKGASYYGHDPQLSRYDDASSLIEGRWTPGGPAARVEGNYTDRWGPRESLRGNRPTFKMQIYGDNLWGHHVIDVGAVDLEPLSGRYILGDDRTSAGMTDPRQVLGIETTVVIWLAVTPGKKVLRVDGTPIPFELVINGFPGKAVDETAGERPKPVKLFFVRKTDTGLERVTDKTLRYGDLFAVEVEMESDRDRTVKLEWGSGMERQILVRKVKDNPRLLRSDLLRLEPPPSSISAPPSAPKPR